MDAPATGGGGGRLELPWEPLPALSPRARERVVAEALELNERYLLDVIERYAFCPFAKEGREAGETRREVLLAEGPSVEPFLEAMERTVASGVVVTQVIVPLVEVGPADFTRFCVELTAAGHRRLGGPPVLAVAPLHPELPFGEGPLAMVPLFRRAPDPTIQWVRLDGLDAIYEGRSAEDRFVSPDQVLAYLERNPRGDRDLYGRIAATNAAMARRLGVERVEALLGEIASRGRRRYAHILLSEDA